MHLPMGPESFHKAKPLRQAPAVYTQLQALLSPKYKKERVR